MCKVHYLNDKVVYVGNERKTERLHLWGNSTSEELGLTKLIDGLIDEVRISNNLTVENALSLIAVRLNEKHKTNIAATLKKI